MEPEIRTITTGEGETLPDYNLPNPKLSDLIRQGCTKHPQAFGRWFDRDVDRTVLKTCALGAAAMALNYSVDASMSKFKIFQVLGWNLRWSTTLLYPSDVPSWDFEDVTKPVTVFTAVAMLNDEARWTREEIADWLAEQGY